MAIAAILLKVVADMATLHLAGPERLADVSNARRLAFPVSPNTNRDRSVNNRTTEDTVTSATE
jgi:hypothetical protein